jgi:hypothetical protein
MEIKIQDCGGSLTLSLPFIGDTGSDYMTLLSSDLDRLDNLYLQNNLVPPPRLFKLQVVVNEIGGSWEAFPKYRVEVAFAGSDGHCLADWDAIDVLIIYDSLFGHSAPVRVNGPWLRHKLHTATAPDGTTLLTVFRNKTAV